MIIPFIGEDVIESVAETLSDSEKYYDETVAEMQGKQPVLFSYLLSESFKLLTREEKDFLFYIAVVIWRSVDEQGQELPVLMSDNIEEIEEKNWTVLNESKARQFRDKLDAFFKKYPQEDLLAFVEDALVDDEDSFVTKEGRELLFIGLKTTIDSLCGIHV